MVRSFALAFCMFSMVCGPHFSLAAETVSTPNVIRRNHVSWETAEFSYRITGLEAFEQMSASEWESYISHLSPRELSSLQTNTSITMQLITVNYIFTINSEGYLLVEDQDSNTLIQGFYQSIPENGIVIYLFDSTDSWVEILWNTQGSDYITFFDPTQDKVIKFKDFQSDLWTNRQLNTAGFFSLQNSTTAAYQPVDGNKNFNEGSSRFILGGLIGLAVAGIVIGIKCIKDGLWDPYDCTPGTIACSCNGCDNC